MRTGVPAWSATPSQYTSRAMVRRVTTLLYRVAVWPSIRLAAQEGRDLELIVLLVLREQVVSRLSARHATLLFGLRLAGDDLGRGALGLARDLGRLHALRLRLLFPAPKESEAALGLFFRLGLRTADWGRAHDGVIDRRRLVIEDHRRGLRTQGHRLRLQMLGGGMGLRRHLMLQRLHLVM